MFPEPCHRLRQRTETYNLLQTLTIQVIPCRQSLSILMSRLKSTKEPHLAPRLTLFKYTSRPHLLPLNFPSTALSKVEIVCCCWSYTLPQAYLGKYLGTIRCLSEPSSFDFKSSGFLQTTHTPQFWSPGIAKYQISRFFLTFFFSSGTPFSSEGLSCRPWRWIDGSATCVTLLMSEAFLGCTLHWQQSFSHYALGPKTGLALPNFLWLSVFKPWKQKELKIMGGRYMECEIMECEISCGAGDGWEAIF